MEAENSERRSDPARVREVAEEVRKLANRARGIPHVSQTAFRLLPERDGAELLHNLSAIRRAAEAMLRQIEEGG